MAILQLPAVSLGVPVSPRDARKQPAHPVMVESLTPCELRVLELICEGHSNKEIALQLGVGLPTVKYHVYLIFRKLGASRRTQAVALAIHWRLVCPDWLRAMPQDKAMGRG